MRKKRTTIEETNLKRAGKALKKYLVANQITNIKFARLVERAESTVWRWIKGKRSPSKADRIRIAETTGYEYK